MPIRPSSALRATGAALAVAVGNHAPRAVRVALLAGSDLAARRIDPVGLQPLAISPRADLNLLVSVEPDAVAAATGAASWTVLNLLVGAGLRKSRLPAPLLAVAVGAGVFLADVAVSRAPAGDLATSAD